LEPHVACKDMLISHMGQPALPTLTLSTTPPQQMPNDVADHAFISCLFQGEQCNPPKKKTPPTPFRRASPRTPCCNLPLEDSFTRVSGYWRTDHCAGAPVHMSQHDRRVSRHVCQLTFPTLSANARGLRGERRRGEREKNKKD